MSIVSVNIGPLLGLTLLALGLCAFSLNQLLDFLSLKDLRGFRDSDIFV